MRLLVAKRELLAQRTVIQRRPEQLAQARCELWLLGPLRREGYAGLALGVLWIFQRGEILEPITTSLVELYDDGQYETSVALPMEWCSP